MSRAPRRNLKTSVGRVRLSDEQAAEQNQSFSISFNHEKRYVTLLVRGKNSSEEFPLRSDDFLTDCVG